MKRFVTRRLVVALCAAGMMGLSIEASASAFQLWEQDGASIGNYHAGYAAEANDASTAWYNPAGITRIKNQQIVLGGAAILTNFQYNGSVTVTNPPSPAISNTPNVTAQGGTFGLVPAFHYVSPVNDWIGYGFSVDVPFGLKTNYGSTSAIRYANTLTSITVVDISPSLGFQVTEKGSLGIGFDFQKAYAEFNNVDEIATDPGSSDTRSLNDANDTGYGIHFGGLYEFTESTRVGLSYHSQVVHHLSGWSEFTGPLNVINEGYPLRSGSAKARVTLPPYTALSIYHRPSEKIALKGSVIYTQWSTIQELTLQNVAGIVINDGVATSSTSINVVIPEHYRNTWNFAAGADYFATDDVILRAGLGYDQTPVSNTYRNAQLPDNNRYVIALGSHFQASQAWGFDLGWSHFFFKQARTTPPPMVAGAQTTNVSGHVNGGADVFGAQVTWNIL